MARETIKKLQQQMKLQQNIETMMQLNSQYVKAAQDLEVEYQFQRALKAIIEGQFDEAFERLKKIADKNYAKAQEKSGHMYERGMGVDINYQKAIEWYLKSIKNGNPAAYTRLGFIYERGLGVRQSFDKAIELGDHHGQSRLGVL